MDAIDQAWHTGCLEVVSGLGVTGKSRRLPMRAYRVSSGPLACTTRELLCNCCLVSFKQRLSTTGVLRGVINVIPSAVATQAIAAAGADFVMIDREHGPIGREAMHAMIASTAGTECSPLVRVPGIDEAEVKTALDAGAEGIVYHSCVARSTPSSASPT